MEAIFGRQGSAGPQEESMEEHEEEEEEEVLARGS